MCKVNFIWVFYICFSQGYIGGLTSHLRCKDNDNRPLDWWYIYKPPSRPYAERSGVFAYLTPGSAGRWQPSEEYITSSSMLMNTIKPLFSTTYINEMAVIVYNERPGDKGSTARGILLADEDGGIWISHTVTGFPDLSQFKPSFPEDEIENGHMFFCMTLDHKGLDGVLKVIYQTEPEFTEIRVPPNLAAILPNWNRILLQKMPEPSKLIGLTTQQKTLYPIVVVRKPGEIHSLYQMFAKAKKIVIDVYGDPDMDETICSVEFGLRKIDVISLKFPEEIQYIDNSTDKITFGVSTAAHWQRTGAGPTQYWTCVSSYENQNGLARGNMLLCVHNYDLWIAFDNLKVKEPTC